MMKSVLLGGLFLTPVLAGLSGERGLKRRWEDLQTLRRETGRAVLLLENSRRPLQGEMNALAERAEGLGEAEGALLRRFVEEGARVSRGELLLLGREAEAALEKAEIAAEEAYKSRGRLCRVLGLAGGSGILLLLL